MKNITLSVLLILIINIGFSQYNPRPTNSRFFNSKNSTFQIKSGDILVYNVKSANQSYDAIVTVLTFGEAITFDYKVPEKKQSGNIQIKSDAVNNASSYRYIFNDYPAFSDGSITWLSKKNWRDLASKDQKTTMDFGSGSESFIRERASTLKIKYKGKEKIITIYDIANADNGNKKTFSTLTDEQNPLIVRMNNNGYKMTLKEVR